MHDPMTVAFEIRSPFGRKSTLFPKGWHAPVITIWHVDPEVGGDDDSCDWFGMSKTRTNGWYPVHLDEYAALPEDARRAVDFLWWGWNRKLGRPWWKHPRWHVRHWQFQVHPLQDLKRWLFSRCSVCGKRFPWGYAPIGPWSGEGPRWFKGEPGVYHHECVPPPPEAIPAGRK
jgi:hypothetical protein